MQVQRGWGAQESDASVPVGDNQAGAMPEMLRHWMQGQMQDQPYNCVGAVAAPRAGEGEQPRYQTAGSSNAATNLQRREEKTK